MRTFLTILLMHIDGDATNSPHGILTEKIFSAMKTFSTLLILLLILNSSNAQPTKVGDSGHFEFYTDIPDKTEYWMEIKDTLENEYLKLSSLWNRPGIEDVFDENVKIKIYYSDKEDIAAKEDNSPSWKNGFMDINSLEIYISPLVSEKQINFYKTISKLAVNQFSQLALYKKFQRVIPEIELEPYFLEGFGLYEMGERPKRDSVVKYLNNNPVPDFNFLTDTTGISNSLKKDMILTNIEGQLLTTWSYMEVNPGASSYIYFQWPNYLNYFYAKSETSRIKFMGSTEHFDYYWAESDTAHYSEVAEYFEDKYDFYVSNYKFEPKHKINIVIVPSEPIGMALTGYDNFNGGAGCGGDLVIELSPNYNYNEENYYSKYFGYEGMCAHEFFHVYYNHFMWEIWGGFWAEGSADFSQRHSLGWEVPPHSLWKIEGLFTYYTKDHNVELTLEEISSNPYEEIDIYFLGDCFFEFLYEKYGGYEKIMEFFNKQMDYSVFDATYEEIDKGYINFLKSLVNYIPRDTLISMPFTESFNDFSNGWSKPSYINPDNWQIDEGETYNCARFYTSSDKNVPLESWLVSPALNAKDMEQINLSFDFARYGEGIEIDVFYTDKFEEFTDSTNWTWLKSIQMPIDWGISNTGKITINNPSDTLFIGIRMKSTGEQHQQLYIDNFKANGILTSVDAIKNSQNDLKVYPNPLANESVISFQTKTSENVNLSIFDIQGRKICTLLDEKLNAGKHTMPVSNSLPTSGVYFCKLLTSEGISTNKIIVNSK